MNSQKEWVEQHQRMVALLPSVEAELRRLPGVVAVEIGVKESHGELTGKLAFRVYVEEKLPADELPTGTAIPAEIHGFPTDVIRRSRPSLTAYEDKRRPLLGGIQIGNNFSSGVGTLGCIARRTSDNALVLLSNDHVLMGGNASGEIKVGQPKYSKSCCCECNVVGQVVANQNNGDVDSAIALLNGDISAENVIRALNADGTDGVVNGSHDLAAPPTDDVVKVGRTSNRTAGTVVSITHPTGANTTEGIPARSNQILIRPATGTTLFQNRGDSGAVLVDSSNRVIGLMWGAYLGDPSDSLYGHGIACPIAAVRSALNITIPSGALTSAAMTNRAPAPAGRDGEAGAPAPFPDTIESRLRETETGRRILQVAYRHLDEVLHLVNHHRPVTVVWRRRQGPAFVAAIARSAREPDYRIPARIDGVSLRGLLLQMAAVLDEHGGDDLRQAVGSYLPLVLDTLPACQTFGDFLDRIRQLDEVNSPAAGG